MSPRIANQLQRPPGFPRASGDEPCVGDDERLEAAFSPRERG